MSRSILLSLVVCIGSVSALAGAADDPSEMLARAEALYYQADFAKSIELLLRADELLAQQLGRMKEKSSVKLQIALAYIGLNDAARAKTYLQQLYAIDPDHQIDPQVFSPKVIQLAEEAKAQQAELECRSRSDDAQRQLAGGNSQALIKLLDSNSKCPGLVALYPKAAELFYKQGVETYKRTDVEGALAMFRTALRLDPKNELASEYVDLAQTKLEAAADRALLAWRKDYDAGAFDAAGRDYKDLVARGRPETVESVRAEYRRALSDLVDSWNRACSKADAAAMEGVRRRISALQPDPTFGQDLLSRMTSCTSAGCIAMPAQLALARLKTRVDPQFPSYVLSQIRDSQITVRVKATISDKGDVSAGDVLSGNALVNPAVRTAVEQWKFVPAVIQGEARCVETEIPLAITFNRN